MPLLYAIEGIHAPYERITPIQPVSAAAAATLHSELLRQELPQDQAQSHVVSNYQNRHSALKGYDEATTSESTERKPVLNAQDLMTKSLFRLNESSTLSEARELMQKENIHHIPILNADDTLAGILSDRDILRAGQALQLPVSTQMTRRVLTATPDTTIPEIAEAMLAHHIHAMPIIDTDLRIVGILTPADILRAVVRRAPLALWA